MYVLHMYTYTHIYTFKYTYIYVTYNLLHICICYLFLQKMSIIHTYIHICKHPIHNGRGVKKLKYTTKKENKSASKQVTSKKANY